MSQNASQRTDRIRADGRRAMEKVKGLAWSGFSAAVESYFWAQGTPKLENDDQYPSLHLPPAGIDCPICARCLSLLSYCVTRFGDGNGYKPLKITHGRFGTGCRICTKASEMWDLAMAHGRFARDYLNVGRSRWTWQWHMDSTDPSRFPNNTAIRETHSALGIGFEACYLQHSFRVGWVSITPSQPIPGAPLPTYTDASFDLTVPLIDPHADIQDHFSKYGIHIKIMLEWLQECIRTHPRCRRLSRWLPDRLVAYDANRGLYRIVRKDHEPDQQFLQQHKIYLSLSHCWGPGKHLNLVTANYEEWCNEIPFDQLPATLRDALTVMVKLGTGLMWIDSLCILQDSKEDWLVQSAQMADVYKNAICNLAIVSAESDDEGFLRNRDLAQAFGFTCSLAVLLGRRPGESNIVPTWSGDQRQVALLLNSECTFHWRHAEYPNNRMERHALYKRGWVFQERELPRRTLGITKGGPFYSCDTSRRDEYQNRTLSLSTIRGVEEQQFESTWSKYITQYTACKLTVPSDRLIAISAIAKELAPPGVRYLAGLWDADLLRRLTWRILPDQATAAVPYIAPSWSWASVVAPIDSSAGDTGIALAKIVDVQVFPVTDFIYGSVKGGFLHMRGRLYTLRDIRPEHQTDHPIRGYPLLRLDAEPMNLQYRADTIQKVYADQVCCLPICASSACPRGYLLTTYLIIQEVESDVADAAKIYRRVGIGQAQISLTILGVTQDTDRKGITGRNEQLDVDVVIV